METASEVMIQWWLILPMPRRHDSAMTIPADLDRRMYGRDRGNMFLVPREFATQRLSTTIGST
jgi:hypothetical protein